MVLKKLIGQHLRLNIFKSLFSTLFEITNNLHYPTHSRLSMI
uniref:Uncharacterized protein n=1 Tax=Nelumbo nucifera TaxID=4432 RepID=A0A822ZB34_NELNU|nr:TPA_asm: hypothetical protein HUJ06_013060 [Nelumbo nucifera]